MPLQHFLIDAGAAVIALEEAYRGKLDQVLIADPALREQDEMRIRGAERRVSGGLFPRLAAVDRGGGLDTPNRAGSSRVGFRGKVNSGELDVAFGDHTYARADHIC